MSKADAKFQKKSDMGIPFLSFYSTILARLAYFTSDHFLPAYLETMGPIIPDALIKYINDTDGSKLLPSPDGSSVGSLEDGVYTSDPNVPTYQFNGKSFVDFTDYAKKFNTQMEAREKKPYHYIAPRIVEHKAQDYTVAYINISTSNYAGNWVLVDTRMPDTIFVIFRGTYSAKSAGSYTKPSSLLPSKEGLDLEDGKKYGSLGGIHKILGDDINAIIEAMGDLSEKYLNASTRQDGSIKVITTGHSLGGGLCTLFASDFYELDYNDDYQGIRRFSAFDRKITCVSIAAPRVLNKTLADLFCDRVSKKLLFFERMIARGDPVPALPPSKFGFRHPCSGRDDNDPVLKSITLRLSSNIKIRLGVKISYSSPPSAENMKKKKLFHFSANPLAHTEYLYVMFTKAVPIGAFLHSTVMPGFLKKKGKGTKQMEVERTKKGHTVERFTRGVINVNAPFSGTGKYTGPKLTFSEAFIDLEDVRGSNKKYDALMTQAVYEFLEAREQLVEGDPNRTYGDVLDISQIAANAHEITILDGLINTNQKQKYKLYINTMEELEAKKTNSKKTKKKGGRKKRGGTKKCVGKRDGKSGCRRCCTRKYKRRRAKCVTRCMKH